MSKRRKPKESDRCPRYPWEEEYEAMLDDPDATRIFLVMTLEHALELAEGRVPEMVKGEAQCCTSWARGEHEPV